MRQIFDAIRFTVCLAALTAVAAPAPAIVCSNDQAPSSTLLLPYFEVDISDADSDGKADCSGVGLDTVFTIGNASDQPVLAHVILWTDWAYASINFDVFLTGYDVQRISLCELIGQGRVPATADAGNDPEDTISPHKGANSDHPLWDGAFPSCNGLLPPNPLIKPALDLVQNAHAGFPVPALGNSCAGEGLNGSGQCASGSCPPGTIARGYVTIDSVSQCSTFRHPGETGYLLDGGTGIANNANVLWGDYQLIDFANNFAQGEALVHIEAHDDLDAADIPLLDPTDPTPLDPAATPVATVSNPNTYTFYRRYSALGQDNREPLGTTWAARYGTGGQPENQLIIWRDAKFDPVSSGFSCGLCDQGAGPPWCPLSDGIQLICWDDAEDAVELCTFIVSGGIQFDFPCPWTVETQRIQFGQGNFTPPAASGWCFLNLNHTLSGGDPTSGIAQSYVTVLGSSLGRFSTGTAATQLTSACSSSANPFITGDLGQILPP